MYTLTNDNNNNTPRIELKADLTIHQIQSTFFSKPLSELNLLFQGAKSNM